tara:strand:+ start:905 stop:1558 length:654 start_codon:yes stop_codon:yes gene_type:complete
MEPKPTLSDLLALRDGERVEADAAGAGGDREPEVTDLDPDRLDAASRETLAELRRMKAELNALPPVTPDPAVWEAIQERTAGGGSKRGWLDRFPLATAATVFLAAALTIVLWDPTAEPGGSTAGPQVQDPVAALMVRSQRLEAELFTRAAAPSVTATSSEQALLYGIADVDAQLNALYESEGVDASERERLWRQRVALLESLADVQRGQAVMRPAIY